MHDIHYNDISEWIFLVLYITEQVKCIHTNNLKIIPFSETIKISLISIQHVKTLSLKNTLAIYKLIIFFVIFSCIYIFRET